MIVWLEFGRVTAGAVRFVGGIRPCDRFIVGFVTRTATHTRVVRPVIRRDVGERGDGCPAGCAVAGIATSGGDKVAAVFAGR